MPSRAPFNRAILRAVLRNVNPMVIRVITVPVSLDLPDFDEVFRAVLGWDGLWFIFRVHGQECNSFRSVSRSPRPCARSNCVRGRPFSTPAARSIFGNGSAASGAGEGKGWRRGANMFGRPGRRSSRTLRQPHWISADPETAKAGRGDVHTRADGRGDGNALRFRSERARQYLAEAAASVA